MTKDELNMIQQMLEENRKAIYNDMQSMIESA